MRARPRARARPGRAPYRICGARACCSRLKLKPVTKGLDPLDHADSPHAERRWDPASLALCTTDTCRPHSVMITECGRHVSAMWRRSAGSQCSPPSTADSTPFITERRVMHSSV